MASPSYQNSSDNEIENVYDESSNPTANMVLEEPTQKYIDTIAELISKNDILKSRLSLAKILNLRL